VLVDVKSVGPYEKCWSMSKVLVDAKSVGRCEKCWAI